MRKREISCYSCLDFLFLVLTILGCCACLKIASAITRSAVSETTRNCNLPHRLAALHVRPCPTTPIVEMRILRVVTFLSCHVFWTRIHTLTPFGTNGGTSPGHTGARPRSSFWVLRLHRVEDSFKPSVTTARSNFACTRNYRFPRLFGQVVRKSPVRVTAPIFHPRLNITRFRVAH